MEEPLLSVCLITYNHINYIREAIESVLMQKVKFSWELIIADDCSSDGTREILLEYKNRYPDFIKLILQSKNVGPGPNWIDLQSAPQSKYIAYFEGDDYWTDPLKLQKQVDFLESNFDFAGCFHYTQVIYEDGKLGNIYGMETKSVLSAADTFSICSPFHTSSFVYRNVIQKFPDWIYNVASGDMALFSIVSSFGKLYKIPEIMSVYRKHSFGITSSQEITSNFHQKRIELANYLNDYHMHKYKNKAEEIILFHECSIIANIKKNISDWQQVVLPNCVKRIDTMISIPERQLLYYLGCNYWRGLGAIVDAGCFLGGSTISLGMGLLANPTLFNKDKVIYSYDLFLADFHQSNSYLKKYGSYAVGDSIRNIFDRNTNEISHLLNVYHGDLMNFSWNGSPIEILFIDVAKTWELNDYIVSNFFTNLIPNYSLVIQQDLVHPTCPWLAITMEFFADYFEILSYVPNNSVVYLYKRAIPMSLIKRSIISKFSNKDKMVLMDKAIERFEKILHKNDLVELECARLIMKLWQSNSFSILDDIKKVNMKYVQSARLKSALEWVNMRIDQKNSEAVVENDKFINIQLTPDNIDLYYIRTSIKRAIDENLQNFCGTFLDIGCGEMPYKTYLLNNSKIEKYIGMDIENPIYQKKFRPDLFWNGTKIPLDDNSVDTVMATEVFEHTPVIDSVLIEIFRVLKPGGILFFTVPYLWPLHDVPHDEYRYTPFSLERHFKTAGYENINIKPTGGWDAALAQMIGLWLKRRPMSDQERKSYTDNMFNLYKDLLAADQVPQNYGNGPMITGLAGTVSKPAVTDLQKKFSPNRIFSMLNQVKYNIESKQSPKVVIVVNLFPTITETFILDQIVGLIKRGVNLEIWAQSNPRSATIHPDVISYGLLKITKYLRLPKISITDSNRWYKIFLEQNPELNFENISLFHVHFGQNFNNLSPIYLLNKKPVIVSFHGLDASQYIKTNGPGCYEQLFERANTITTPSYEMKNVLIDNGCAEAKIKIHRYGVDLDKFKPSLQSQNNKVTTILSVARFVEKKGMIYALQAIASLSHFNFVYRIIGEGHLEAELKSAVEKLGIQDKVKFLGTKSKDEIVQEMQTADIYILTSITASNGDKEGLPVTLIESQAVGLPAVTTYHSGIPELVKNEISGLVCEEKDVAATAKNIQRLIMSKELRDRLSANARIIVQREFDIEQLNDNLKTLYFSLIDVKNSHSGLRDLK